MPRPIRFQFDPHAVFEITCRTIQGRLLLNPSPVLNLLVLGVLGRALYHFRDRIRLFCLAFLSNHFHLLLSAQDSKVLSEFMGYCESNIARAVGRLHSWTGPFWGGRFKAIQVLDDQSMIERLEYLLAHGVKEGFVRRVMDWPGISCARALVGGEPLRGTWFDRTAMYHARRSGQDCSPERFATEYDVPLARLPCWNHLSEEEHRQKVESIVAKIERRAADEAPQQDGGTLPARALPIEHPHTRPPHVKRSPAPQCHAATRELRRWFRDTRRAFVLAYRAAATLVRRGRPTEAVFPPNSFPPGLPYVPFAAAAMTPRVEAAASAGFS